MKNIRRMLVAAVLVGGIISFDAAAAEPQEQKKDLCSLLPAKQTTVNAAGLAVGLYLMTSRFMTNQVGEISIERFDMIVSGLTALYDNVRFVAPGLAVSGLMYAYMPGAGNKEAITIGSIVSGSKTWHGLERLNNTVFGSEVRNRAFIAAVGLTATGSYIANPYIAQVLPKFGNKIKNNGPDYKPGLKLSRDKGVTLTL